LILGEIGDESVSQFAWIQTAPVAMHGLPCKYQPPDAQEPDVPEHDVERSSTTEGLPIAPSLGPALVASDFPTHNTLIDGRAVLISGLAVALAVVSGLVAQLLTRLIGLFTNLAFYGRWSSKFVSPGGHQLGGWVVLVPAGGGLLVGLMARYGSKAIRGHGIPEAMEQVLTNGSRIPARMTFLKPLSAAISIGTGGPFGAEGPIIATGGALGSLLGQLLRTSAGERKTLLAAGAAAGMAATFGSPIAAVLLAVELLLFEYRPRSLVPVALAAAVAAGVRVGFAGAGPAFAMPDLVQPGGGALVVYTLLGAVLGLASVAVTRAVYAVEDGFERLPLHWMWWPALGGLVVGLVGLWEPRTMGVGYDNIERIIGGDLLLTPLLVLCGLKFVSWVIALGSGTSGGTLAPLFTIGGGMGAALGVAVTALCPGLGVDVRIAALVGMAALFAGASRAPLTSIIFAFETTRQPVGLLPLLAGCTAAFSVSCLLMKNSIMTEKIVRRGVRVLGEYTADFLDQIHVRDCALRLTITLSGDDTLGNVRAWLASRAPGTTHQGFPVVDGAGRLIGVVTRRDLIGDAAAETPLRQLLRRAPVVIHDDCSLREAADQMARARIGRLPVVSRSAPTTVIGIITRSDLVDVHARRLEQHQPG
jgi:CIC family chloride channel protein